MEIALHIGANCTEGERLLKSLLRNANRLARAGVAVPGPTRYRPVLREAVLAQVRGQGTPDSREVLLDAILDGREARRVVLSNNAFMALPAMVLDGRAFFGTAPAKVQALCDIFADDRVELFLTVRNFATWLPAIHAQVPNRNWAAFSAGIDPRALRWSELVERLRRAVPDTPITVWCNEDSALVWSELMALMAGLPDEEALEGRYDMMGAIMAQDGMERFEKYMALHPGQGASQERRVIGAFLDKYAIAERVEEEVDLPGWDEALVEDLTRAYEADVEAIGRIEGVTLVAP